MPGRRITRWASRYQPPLALPARAAPPLATFAPQIVSSAGEIVSAATAATIATMAPAIPIDFKNPSGNTTSVASAHATVTAEKQTVAPARVIVARSACCSDAPSANSWR